MAKKKEEITETNPGVVESPSFGLDPITADFGRADLNEMRDKVNHLIQCQK